MELVTVWLFKLAVKFAKSLREVLREGWLATAIFAVNFSLCRKVMQHCAWPMLVIT